MKVMFNINRLTPTSQHFRDSQVVRDSVGAREWRCDTEVLKYVVPQLIAPGGFPKEQLY